MAERHVPKNSSTCAINQLRQSPVRIPDYVQKIKRYRHSHVIGSHYRGCSHNENLLCTGWRRGDSDTISTSPPLPRCGFLRRSPPIQTSSEAYRAVPSSSFSTSCILFNDTPSSPHSTSGSMRPPSVMSSLGSSQRGCSAGFTHHHQPAITPCTPTCTLWLRPSTSSPAMAVMSKR